MTNLTKEQANELLSLPLEKVKDFIRTNTEKPKKPAWASGRFDAGILRDVADQIDRQLIWDRTPQGHSYWSKVKSDLLALLAELR